MLDNKQSLRPAYRPGLNSREPIFRVTKGGTLVQVGTAKELQILFGLRHRCLKQRLLQQINETDDYQYQQQFQVELEADYREALQAERKFAQELYNEITNSYQRPETLEEEEAMAQPNRAELLAQLKKRRCKDRRYRIRRRLSERIAGGLASPETDTVTMPNGEKVKVTFGSEVDATPYLPAEDTPPTGRRRAGGGIDWDTRKTPEELEFIQQKKDRYNARRASLIS